MSPGNVPKSPPSESEPPARPAYEHVRILSQSHWGGPQSFLRSVLPGKTLRRPIGIGRESKGGPVRGHWGATWEEKNACAPGKGAGEGASPRALGRGGPYRSSRAREECGHEAEGPSPALGREPSNTQRVLVLMVRESGSCQSVWARGPSCVRICYWGGRRSVLVQSKWGRCVCKDRSSAQSRQESGPRSRVRWPPQGSLNASTPMLRQPSGLSPPPPTLFLRRSLRLFQQ